ncbi:MAG: protein kinase [Vicinamibacteraceae bacterium]
MSGPPSEDHTVLPPTLLDDAADSATRLDAPAVAAARTGPAGTAESEGATILGTMLVGADATVFVDDRVGAFEADDRAATVMDAADAATLLDPNAPSRRAPRAVPPTGEATAVPTGRAAASTDATGAAAVPPPNVRYVLETLAGRGGMGTVHVARDVELLRRVALKELSLEVAHDRSARSRFVREVQVTAQLDHPHIVPVYSLEVASGGRPAYAMKLVDGQTFGQLITDTRAIYDKHEKPDDDHSLPARLEHFLKVCDAIAYAHERGVVHRDLKPANLMVGKHNEVYVMDWGICRLMTQPAEPASAPTVEAVTAATANPARTGSIARTAVSLDASHGETAYGAIVGTPLYMSPEQATGRHDELDAKSDQCALGLILFEMVTLKRPLSGKTLAEVLTQASAGTREPLVHAFGEAVPGELGAIVTKASAGKPADRYASVADLADDLRRFMRGDAVRARPDSAWQRGVRWLGRHRQAAALTLLGLVVAILAGGAALLYRQERALEAQERREHQIERLVADVGEQGDRLQLSLLELHDALDMAVSAIGHAYEYGQPSTGPLLWDGASHDMTIGFDAAPGVPRAQVEAEARRVVTVGASVKRVIEAVREHLGRGSANGHQQLDAAASGLHELRAGFETGLKFTVPAAALERTQPDVRQAAWYKAVSGADEFHWSLVQHDSDDDPELALSAPIIGDSGRRIGAAGLVVALDHALANLIAARPVEHAKITLLLDHTGTLLASHTTSGGVGGGARLLKLIPAADLAAIIKNDIGFVETDRLGEPHILAFDTIQPLKWTLVTIAETSAVVGRR